MTDLSPAHATTISRTDPISAAPPAPAVHESIDYLGNAIDQLFEAAIALERRLSPVLHPLAATELQGDPDAESRCPISGQLDNLAARVRQIVGTLADVDRRLEV